MYSRAMISENVDCVSRSCKNNVYTEKVMYSPREKQGKQDAHFFGSLWGSLAPNL